MKPTDLRRRPCRMWSVLAVAALLGGLAPAGTSAASPFAGVRNVIVFVGDGMGPSHLQLGRMLNGGALALDSMPWGGAGTLDTTSLSGVTDSAAAATALATGAETLNGWVSMVPADLSGGDLTPVPVETALERAKLRGRATGLVTDLELSDATPAAFAAHVVDRDLGYEITTQMAARGIEVLFSGGWSESYLLGTPDVTSLRELAPFLAGTMPWPDRMLGIFGKTSLAYTIDREEEDVLHKQPTLPQLTAAALGVLSRDPDGFFLMVEGGANDWGGHARDAAWVGAEIRELDQAVRVAYEWAASRGDTLIVLVGDHETGGLTLGPATDYQAIARQTASTEWMWGLIRSGKATVAKALADHAGIAVTAAETSLILQNGEMGIADVLAARCRVAWGWSGRDEGDHTATPVPVMAWGPGASQFAIPGLDNERIGQLLREAASQ